jgi:glycosyltransferase involved in cell wall biosynthesis
MSLPDDGQEFVVVDNCPSTDATKRLVERYPRVRYVFEPRPGLDIARNCALREAKHDFLVFTDDDAVPDPNWLRMLLRNFEDPRVACVTGLTMPVELETEAQEWFQRLGGLGRGFKRMVFDGACHDPFDGWQAGAGVNMAVRRDVVLSLGSFDEGLDVGTPVRGGGDTDMLRRILAGGHRIIYDPEALNWHRHRASWRDLRRQLRGYESAGFAVWTRSLLIEREFGALQQAWKWLWRELPGLYAALLRRPGTPPIDLVLARFVGALTGPWAYVYARWRLYKASAAR